MSTRGSKYPSRRLAPLYVARRLLPQVFTVPDSHRDRGMHWVAASGSGKSLALGLIAFADFLRGVPQVLFDPTGGLANAFLTNVGQFSKPIRQQLWPYVQYVDMAARGDSCVPLPLLFEYPEDTRQDIADRFL